MHNLSVIIANDDILAIDRLEILLNDIGNVQILDKIEEPEMVFESVKQKNPDILLLDIEMPGMDGLEIAEQIKKAGLNTKIIFVTGFGHYAIQAIKQSAFDYLMKPVAIDELKKALNRFTEESHSLKHQTEASISPDLKISERELEIIQLLSKGLNSKEIAEKLFLSSHTIDTYRRKLLAKTNTKNSAELIRFMLQNRII